MPTRRPSRHYSYLTIGGVTLAALLSLWGAFASYGFESGFQRMYKDPYLVAAQSSRFEGVVSAIPQDAQLGYLTDASPGSAADAAMFLSAQYYLAPRLLKRGATQQLVLGDFTRPGDFARIGASQGLRVQQDLGDGIVIFRKEH